MKIIYLILIVAFASCSNGDIPPSQQGKGVIQEVDTAKVDSIPISGRGNK